MSESSNITCEVLKNFKSIRGLVLRFTINGRIFERFSMYNKLCWWKDIDIMDYFLREQEDQLEEIARAFIEGSKFKELYQIEF